MTGAVESPTAPGSTQEGIALSFPTCDAQWCATPQDAPRICRRRAEWMATAVGHNGSILARVFACADTSCRGKAAAVAWQERDVAIVEIRQIEDRH